VTCALKPVARTNPSYGARHAFRCDATRIDMQNADPSDLNAILYGVCNFPTAKQPQRARTAKISGASQGMLGIRGRAF
jgi:hypothetical protein